MFLKLVILFLTAANFASIEARVQINIRPAKVFDPNGPKITLQTRLGAVNGLFDKVDITNKRVNVFFGIPYAIPPINKLRFKRTQLIEKLPQNPYQANEFKPHCAQNAQFVGTRYNSNDKFSEDCLYLNIFTPNLEDIKVKGKCRQKFKVIVYIPGHADSANMILPYTDSTKRGHMAISGNLLASYDTIFISLNYRTGLFATLVLGDHFGGNLALWDQNIALKWVRKNIADYCGDENDITLAGNAQGSKFAGLHLISDKSNKFIRNAIMQSGSPLFDNVEPASKSEIIISSFLAINDLNCVDLASPQIDAHIKELDDKTQTKFTQTLSSRGLVKDKLVLSFSLKREIEINNRLRDSKTGKSEIDSHTLELIKFLSKWAVDIKCLQDLPATKLVNVNGFHTQKEWTTYYDSDFLSNKTIAIYKKSNRLNLNPKLNLLIGTMETEECSRVLKYASKYSTGQFNAPQIPKKDAEAILRNETIIISKKTHINDLVAKIYTDETRWQLSNGYFEAVRNLLDDQTVNCPVHFYSKAAAASGANSVSHYVITKKATKHLIDEANLYSYDLKYYDWLGPCRSDELLYLFGAPLRITKLFNNLDRLFAHILAKIWSHFVKNNKMPNLEPSYKVWPTSNKDYPAPRYVEINEVYTRENDFEQKSRCEKIWSPLLHLYKR